MSETKPSNTQQATPQPQSTATPIAQPERVVNPSVIMEVRNGSQKPDTKGKR
ncbi:MAG: hypothetical protein WCK67_12850 [bacterium]